MYSTEVISRGELVQRIKNVIPLKLNKILKNFIVLLILLSINIKF